MLFAVVLTPHPLGSSSLLQKRGAVFCVCGCFNSPPRWGAPLYYKKEERFCVFVVILTPHPLGSSSLLQKRGAVFCVCV